MSRAAGALECAAGADVEFGENLQRGRRQRRRHVFGGIAAAHRLVTKLGLAGQLEEGLDLLKLHLPYHESDHVLNLAYNVLRGGTRLEDIERLRHDTAYMNALGADLIPDPPHRMGGVERSPKDATPWTELARVSGESCAGVWPNHRRI